MELVCLLADLDVALQIDTRMVQLDCKAIEFTGTTSDWISDTSSKVTCMSKLEWLGYTARSAYEIMQL